MPLIQLWEKNPDIVLQYNIKQILSASGDGILSDDSECSKELRHYLENIPAEKLFEHIEFCLQNSFDKSGLVLQDIVNELGNRLDYTVQNGLYQGRVNKIGYDGIWQSPNGHALVVEMKTTDAYRINLDTLASYRDKLIEAKKITSNSSILIAVGRNDTGDLEAQIRGSRHAWDIRVISIEALAKLLTLKIKSDEDETVEKIRSLLIPFEYTRLDNIIDIIFTTAQDVETSVENEETSSVIDHPESKDEQIYKQDRTAREIIDAVRKAALNTLSKKEGSPLIANKRVQYWSSDKKFRVVCAVSKLYDSGYYWYAFHPDQQNFLDEAEKGYFILSCVRANFCYAIPYQKFSKLIPYLNRTENSRRSFAHIHLQPSENGGYFLQLPKKNEKLDLSPYKLNF